MEEKFGTGAVEDKPDNRDYIFEALGSSQVDWKKGYDIEKYLGFKLPVKNQFSSSSCVGQAFSTYRAVKKSLTERRHREVSAKSIYSKIALPNGAGAYFRDGAKTLKDLGALWENLLKSYKDNGVTDESHMTDKSWFNDEMKDIMSVLQVEDYYRVTDNSIDGFAKAIRDGMGMVSGYSANNNGTQRNKYPAVPDLTPGVPANLWHHAVYFGKFKIENGKKYVGALNSWGEETGDNGWQWFGEEWFEHQASLGRSLMFSPWVLINNKKTMNNDAVKILKDTNSSAVGVWLPAISEDVMKSYCLNMSKEVPMKDGHIDWDRFIEGEFSLK